MLRFRSRHTLRISNSLAVFAALTLLVSALVSLHESSLTAKGAAEQTAEIESAPAQSLASEDPGGDTYKKNKSFKVSLFLFHID